MIKHFKDLKLNTFVLRTYSQLCESGKLRGGAEDNGLEHSFAGCGFYKVAVEFSLL